MATVPIEIVLQDAETPVDPTPTPEPGEETNIVVPSTGTISNDRDSNGGIGSAISIILPIVIVVLALGAMVALLIHRQQKRKKVNNDTEECNTKASKKEKFATVASGTIAILAATVLVGNLVIPATKAASDDSSSSEEGTYLETEDKITITATIDKDSEEDIYTVSTKDILYATTDASGYTVTMSMMEGALTSNLYLDGDETSEYYIAPVEANENNTEEGAELSTNTWGYALNEEAEEYNAVPLADTPATIKEGEEAVEHEEIDVYYMVKVNKELPLGTYSGTIEYNIEGNYGFPDTLTTMQGMTHEICESVPTPGNKVTDPVPTATLEDTRDNKTYEVAKLADGNCWMTQNLDLQKEDLLEGVTLDSTNTDDPANGFTLPVSQIDVTDNNKSWGDYGSETDIETAHVYDIAKSGMTYNYCLLYAGDCVEEGDEIPLAALGNLYNWYTATAGTGTFAAGSGGENPYEATGSICPAGWRLPNNSNSSEATEYSTLLSLYGITGSPTSSSYIGADRTAIYKTPLSFVPTGYYNNRLSGVGLSGYLWSSLAYSSTDARSYTFYSGFVQPWLNGRKIYGQGVRCIAK